MKPNGNHSNRLLQNLHFEAFCKEHNFEYYNQTFCNMADFYAAPCNIQSSSFLKFLQIDLLGKIFHNSRVVKKIFSVIWLLSKISCIKFVRFDKENEQHLSETRLLKAFEKHNTVYTAGWWFRAPDLAEKYRSEMQKNYALKPIFYNENSLVKKINALKTEGYMLIGIHIRRGDYRKWRGGKHCYDDDVYEKIMQNISAKISEKHVFIIFSNDNVKFQESENLLISKEDWYIDHHLMSLCDYLYGPPSTFTLWASYIGQAKLSYIYSPENIIPIFSDNALFIEVMT